MKTCVNPSPRLAITSTQRRVNDDVGAQRRAPFIAGGRAAAMKSSNFELLYLAGSTVLQLVRSGFSCLTGESAYSF
jgi:hypothetical protein